ncbi:sugar/maltose fermentation stimulation protein [Klebsiella pneumoniae]|nr:sugar/maltose fermentation stimulation protein [Klebsiella pneumoniae]
MQFDPPLQPAILLKRYNDFLLTWSPPMAAS